MLISHLSKSNKDMYCIEILFKYDHAQIVMEGRNAVMKLVGLEYMRATTNTCVISYYE